MDFYMKQERNLHESELEPELQYPCAKMPKLNLHQQQYYDDPSSAASVSALPLFVPEPKTSSSSTSYSTDLSAFQDATATVTASALSKLPRTGSYFSLAQWQELELQALIYRYMLAGAAVPPELLQPIKKSLLLSHSFAPPYFLHHPLHHFQPALLQSGYWGRLAMDPEPGRCRRTDGKKWRCSRDVVGGHKYCERHMHRGRNRSRKPVETPTPAAAAARGGAGTPITAIPMSAPLQRTVVAGENHFSLSGPSPSADLLNLSQSYAHSKHENKSLFQTQNEVNGNDRSDGHVLRHFFDDWPRSIQETDGSGSNGSALSFATSLSISMPANSSSDVSLKLSTGVGDEPGSRNGETQVVNWGSGWTSSNHVSSMGGPLAEALRSSTSTSSPTSVLHHQLPRNSVSDTSFVSA